MQCSHFCQFYDTVFYSASASTVLRITVQLRWRKQGKKRDCVSNVHKTSEVKTIHDKNNKRGFINLIAQDVGMQAIFQCGKDE